MSIATTAVAYPELVVEDAIGVCSVGNDTRAVAEAAAARHLPGRALDIGTGSGYIGLYLAQRGWDVDAVDISPRAVALAQRNAERNDVKANIYRSDVLSAVSGVFDVIVFNPPMRPDETELSRTVTSFLRRYPTFSGWLMRTVGRLLEYRRHDFLAKVLSDARKHLRPDGSVLMGISREEAEALQVVPGMRLVSLTPIPSMPRQDIAHFRFVEMSARDVSAVSVGSMK
jgi:methylase of polypeptide subunit release factors